MIIEMSAYAASNRKQDIRSELAEARMELEARAFEELTFIRRVHSDASRVLTLITNSNYLGAADMVGGLVHQANRRIVQLRTVEGEPA